MHFVTVATLVAIKRAYVEGIAQRRIRYTFLYNEAAPLRLLIEEARRRAEEIAAEWGSTLCRAELPSVGVLALEWLGGTLLADLSVCFPISRPLTRPVDMFLDAEFKKLSLCLEPLAPIGEILGYSVAKARSLRDAAGRISLRDGVLVVKLKGLYFMGRGSAEPDLQGGIRVEVAKLGCEGIDPLKGLLKARELLRRRGRTA